MDADSMAHTGNAGEHHTFFHTNLNGIILFSAWTTTDSPDEIWKFVVSCVAVFLIAALYEGLKVFREYLLKRQAVAKKGSQVFLIQHSSQELKMSEKSSSQDVVASEKPCSSEYTTSGKPEIAETKMFGCGHVFQALLHMIQVFTSYCLMLIFMTFNAWLCISLIAGAGSGYALFAWKRTLQI